MMALWHRTRAAVAAVIMKDGFRDGHGTYMTDRESRPLL